MFLQTVGTLIIGTIFTLMAAFIVINVATGCVDWSQPNCVTPLQLIGMGK